MNFRLYFGLNLSYSDFQNRKSDAYIYIHAHTHTPGRQLKISFFDVLDYLSTLTLIRRKMIFLQKISFLNEEVKIECKYYKV